MTELEIAQIIRSIGYPVAYHHFAEGQEPSKPYIVYLCPGTDNFSADGTIVHQEQCLRTQELPLAFQM